MNTRMQCRMILFIVATTCLASGAASAFAATSDAERMQWWADHATEALDEILVNEPEQRIRNQKRRMTALVLAYAGQYEQAIQLIKDATPPETGDRGYLAFITGIMAQRGDVAEARAMAGGLESPSSRQSALSLICIRLAQAGRIDAAVAALAEVEEPYQMDRARKWIARAWIKADRLDKAEAVAQAIVEEEPRAQAVQFLQQARDGELPPRPRSPFLARQLDVLTLFSGARPADAHAVAAWRAARAGDKDQYQVHVADALEQLEQGERPSSSARTLTTLTIVAYEAGDHQLARRLVGEAGGAADEEMLGVAGAFGGPILSYVWTRVTPWEEAIEQLEAAAAKDELIAVAGVAAALAEAGAFEQLQAWVQDMDAPEDRLEIALVVVEVCVDLALADEAE